MIKVIPEIRRAEGGERYIYPLNMAMGPWSLLSCDFSDRGYFHFEATIFEDIMCLLREEVYLSLKYGYGTVVSSVM